MVEQAERSERYRDLAEYVGYGAEDERLLREALPLVEDALPRLADAFYDEVRRHEATRRVITGGDAQVARLKRTLIEWMRGVFDLPFTEETIERRWRIGMRHVEIGLPQVYATAALARIRIGLHDVLDRALAGDDERRRAVLRALHRRLDLELAVIEDSYESERERRLEESERFATTGRLASGLVHELRQPLHVLRTSVYYLTRAQRATEEKRAEHLRRIEEQVERANRVLAALSVFARSGRPSLRRLDAGGLLRSALERQPPPDGVVVRIDEAAAGVPVVADPDQLGIVLDNLLRNAYEAMPEGGRVTMTARADERDAVLEVADTGPGLDPSVLERALEPYVSTKEEGFGIGLSLSRAILHGHGGRLEIDSKPGEGATVRVRLPRSDEAGSGRSQGVR